MNKIDVLSDTTWQSQLTTVIASHKTGVVIVLRCQFYLLKLNDLNLSLKMHEKERWNLSWLL